MMDSKAIVAIYFDVHGVQILQWRLVEVEMALFMFMIPHH